MTKQELIRDCYKELGLDPDKNPASMEQITQMAVEIGGCPNSSIITLMAQYIDSQE